MPRPAPRFQPGLVALEPRDNPSAPLVSESFEQVTPPALPAGWQSWSATGNDFYVTTRLTAGGGVTSLASTGSLATRSRFWLGTPQPGDAAVAAQVRTDGPAPAEVITRGQNLGTSTPSYLAAVVTPGAGQVQLVEVQGGKSRVVASVTTRFPVYGVWALVTIQPTGTSASVRVQRPDTGQYLNSQGLWQADPADAIKAGVTLNPAAGLVGVGREPGGQGMEFFDSLTVTAPASQAAAESFDQTAVGRLPAGWRGWTNDGTAGFAASTQRALSPANGLAANGSSVTAARAWLNTTQPADVQASAALYADSLIPGSLIVRGSGLDTATPTYYALTATRGLSVRLVKVVNGVETTLASLHSAAYASGFWVKLTLTADGDQLRAIVFRPDTGRWLAADGSWQDIPQPALSVTDASVTGGGFVGLGRGRLAAGAIAFDDVQVTPASLATGPSVAVTASQPGSTFAGEVTFTATADTARRVEFWLDGQLQAATEFAPAEWTLDTTLLTNGAHQLVVRALDQAGNLGTATVPFTASNPNPSPPPARPELPRKLPNIRIAALAYAGNPMGSFEQTQLRNAVDLVIPNPQFLQTVDRAAPTTPQLIYSNISNLYQGLLTDWLNYADRVHVSRELAFYHVSQPTPFNGSSPSSQPVNRFWGVYGGPVGGTQTDLTSAAYGGRTFTVAFGAAGGAVSIGYPDKFREINYTLDRPAAAGWKAVYEYATAVDASGNPTAWKPLTLLADGTAGLTTSGQVTFDPPADWVAAKLGSSTARLFYVRVRTTAGTAAQAPDATRILGRDYVGANGGTSGVIPAFDYQADANHDGYLSDAEYARRRPGFDARFAYESRLFWPYYGQMRFVTDPGPAAVRDWAADYHARLLAQYPLADGLFLDNTSGRLPFAGTPVIEPTAGYARDTATLVSAVWRKLAPRLVVSNTSGGQADAVPVAHASTGVLEESLLRPTEATWSSVNDVANLVASRLSSDSPPPYVVLDTYPGTLPTTDNRLRVGALAYYYLVADPDRTMVMFFGGAAPSAPWSQTWIPAATVDIGQPTGAMRVAASGQDPANAALRYEVFRRDYSKGTVLYKPLSYTAGKGTGTLADATATTYNLGGSYRVVNGDGTLGAVVTQVTLRNGEGAVLLKV